MAKNKDAFGEPIKKRRKNKRKKEHKVLVKIIKRMEKKMSTKQDLDMKEQEVLIAVQALANLLNASLPTGNFDTEIATLQQIQDLVKGMSDKLKAIGGGATGVPVITVPTLSANAQINVPFSLQVSASGNPTSFAASGLPANLSIDSNTGLISGTPITLGVSSVNLSATNAQGTGTSVLSLTVGATPVPQPQPIPGAVPVISSATSATARVNALFTFQVAATGNPSSFQAIGLPTGLSINPVTGVIFGTPVVAGTSSVNLSATNASGTGNAVLTLTVSA